MEMSQDIEQIILTSPVESKIRDAARSQGMTTMREDAIIKAFTRQVPYSEVNTLSSVLLDEKADLPIAEPVSVTPEDASEQDEPDDTKEL